MNDRAATRPSRSAARSMRRPNRFIAPIGATLPAIFADDDLAQRFVAGLDGRIGEGWTWQAYYQYGQNEQDSKLHNNRIAANYARAVSSVLVGGVPTCSVNADANPANDDPACVPINLFGFGSPSAEALDYIHATSWRLVDLEQNAAAFDLQGTPFATWAGPVSIATGLARWAWKPASSARARSDSCPYPVTAIRRVLARLGVARMRSASS